MTPSFSKRILVLLAFFTLAGRAHAELPSITLTVEGHKLNAEVAANDADRSQGLMYRRMLPETRGMLFVFPETARHAMWMVNTYIPLSVAFLDENGAIINIEDMQPHTRATHAAARPAKYALEANLGWFARHHVEPGARIQGLEKAPAGR